MIEHAGINLSGDPRRRMKERLVHGAFSAAAAVSILIGAAIVVSLLGRALEFLTQIEPGWLLAGGWFPRRNQFGLSTIFAGTLVVAAIAMAVAAPLGLGTAVFLAEYAGPDTRRRLKPIVEILAGIPSIVVGFFALAVISPSVIQRLFDDTGLFNLAAAGIGVGILTVPLIATIAEDAMRAVPGAMREASYGLGARRRSTSLRVVVPAAVSGIVASLIVGFSRAIGETMVVAIVAGGTGGASFTLRPLDFGQTATGAMAALATGSDQVKGVGPAFPSLFFVGLLLFAATFGLNVVSERFVRRVRRSY